MGSPLEDSNTKKVHRYLAELLAELRRMERDRRSGELILIVGVSNGGVSRWAVETSKGGRADQ